MRKVPTIAIVLVLLIQAAQANDEGKRFLDETLPSWSSLATWNGIECGKLSWRAVLHSGVELYRVTVEQSQDHYVLERRHPDGSITYLIKNPKYACTLKTIKGSPRVFSIVRKGDTKWKNAKAIGIFPFFMTSRHGDLVFPHAIDEGKLNIDNYEFKNDHHCLTVHDPESTAFKAIDFEFREEIRSMPVVMRTHFKNANDSGQAVLFRDFENVAGFKIPKTIQVETIENGKSLPSARIDIRVDWEPGNVLNIDKCFCEYYGVAEPDFEVAQENGSTRWLYLVGLAVGLLGLIIWKWKQRP